MKKNFSPQILQISTLILYSQEISLKYVADGAVDYEVCDTHEVEVRNLVRLFIFCKNSSECGEKIFHRKIQRNSYKNSPLSAHSTLKDAGASLVYYRRLSCKILQESCKNLVRLRTILQDLARFLQDLAR